MSRIRNESHILDMERSRDEFHQRMLGQLPGSLDIRLQRDTAIGAHFRQLQQSITEMDRVKEMEMVIVHEMVLRYNGNSLPVGFRGSHGKYLANILDARHKRVNQVLRLLNHHGYVTVTHESGFKDGVHKPLYWPTDESQDRLAQAKASTDEESDSVVPSGEAEFVPPVEQLPVADPWACLRPLSSQEVEQHVRDSGAEIPLRPPVLRRTDSQFVTGFESGRNFLAEYMECVEEEQCHKEVERLQLNCFTAACDVLADRGLLHVAPKLCALHFNGTMLEDDFLTSFRVNRKALSDGLKELSMRQWVRVTDYLLGMVSDITQPPLITRIMDNPDLQHLVDRSVLAFIMAWIYEAVFEYGYCLIGQCERFPEPVCDFGKATPSELSSSFWNWLESGHAMPANLPKVLLETYTGTGPDEIVDSSFLGFVRSYLMRPHNTVEGCHVKTDLQEFLAEYMECVEEEQ